MSEKTFFDQWTLAAEDIRTIRDRNPLTHNQSYLGYLHFAHQVTTGARFHTVLPQTDSIPTYNMIVAACLREAFELGNTEDEVADMKSYNFNRT